MAKRKGSLLRQLTVGLSLAIIFLSLASFYYQYQIQRRILLNSIQADLSSQASVLARWLASAQTPEARQDIARTYVETISRRPERQELIIVDGESRVIASTQKNEPGSLFHESTILSEVLKLSGRPEGVHREVAGTATLAVPVYADYQQTKAAAAILLSQPLVPVDSLANSIMLNAFILLATTLLIIVIVVYYILRVKVHKPMQAIFMQEYRIREGDLAKIEAEDPSNEFSDLYNMYNEMVMRIADQKRAILEQKDHVALAQLVRQAIQRLTEPIEDILNRSRMLLENHSSLPEEEQAALRAIIANITRIARELKSMVVTGDESATRLKHEAEHIRDFKISSTTEDVAK